MLLTLMIDFESPSWEGEALFLRFFHFILFLVSPQRIDMTLLSDQPVKILFAKVFPLVMVSNLIRDRCYRPGSREVSWLVPPLPSSMTPVLFIYWKADQFLRTYCALSKVKNVCSISLAIVFFTRSDAVMSFSSELMLVFFCRIGGSGEMDQGSVRRVSQVASSHF